MWRDEGHRGRGVTGKDCGGMTGSPGGSTSSTGRAGWRDAGRKRSSLRRKVKPVNRAMSPTSFLSPSSPKGLSHAHAVACTEQLSSEHPQGCRLLQPVPERCSRAETRSSTAN